MGTFTAYSYSADPLARYAAVENAYRAYNGRLQVAADRAKWMRMQLNTLHSRLGTSTTDAETQKVNGSIEIADAALTDVETGISHGSEQIQLARTIAQNRADAEREAQRVALDELGAEIETNLQLPLEDFSTTTPNFEATNNDIAPGFDAPAPGPIEVTSPSF
jgi:hypothetical protein